jgi:DNA polymerase-3 subunit delta
MAMVIRQYRMLLQISELQAAGRSRQDIASELRLSPYVVPKMITQTSRFTARQLEVIYARLVETDLALKTSRIDPVMALDTVIVELTKGH